MKSRHAKRLLVECPLCHHEFDDDLSDHLLEEHSRDELVRHIVANQRANE